MHRLTTYRPVIGFLMVLFCLALLPPLYAQSLADALPGDGDIGTEGSTPITIASTVTGMQVGFAREYGKTTIWLRICADSPNFQMRSENVGRWQTEVFHRTVTSGGCSPSTGSWWRMVYNANPNTGEIFRIYATANDTVLSERSFMARAARTDCRVTGYGVGVCTPASPTPVSAPEMAIEEPAGGQTVSGMVTVRGWAADGGSWNGPGVTDVHVRVNGRFIGAATYGESRPNVANYLGDSRYAASGYRITFDSRAFPNGAATVQVSYRSAISGVWHSREQQFNIANGPPAAVHTNTGLRAIIENGKTTVLLKVCGQGNNYRFRSTIASTGRVLFDGVYSAINGCSPEYKAVINASPGETLRFYTTVMNGAISDQEFLQRRRDSCRIDAAGVMRCLVGDTLPPPLPAEPTGPPPPPKIKPCEVPFFSQIDPQWKNHPLRTGHDPRNPCSPKCGTIGACGCTLVSTAMVLRYYGADTDPRRLSECMGNRACLFVWDAARSCSGGKVTGRQGYWGFSYPKLEQALKDGPVVLGMSKTEKGQTYTHFVVVVSGSGDDPNDYVINDPGFREGAKMRLSYYTSRRWSLGDFHRYVGTRPTCPATTAVPEPTTAVSEVSGSGEIYTGGTPATTPHAFLSATVTGSAAVLTMDERTYTLELVAQSDGGPITEMRLSSDTKPNMDWQPFTPYVVMEAGDSVTVEFKDASGNVSAPITVNPHMFQVEPLAIEDYPVYLPMIRR